MKTFTCTYSHPFWILSNPFSARNPGIFCPTHLIMKKCGIPKDKSVPQREVHLPKVHDGVVRYVDGAQGQ
jgi:hypothetical protein